jgi:cyclopropane fatty-acyl-phospholipid synthase-like methyltransferase
MREIMNDPLSKNAKDVDAYKFFGMEAKKYGEQYQANDLAKLYPEHVFRLKIFLNLLSAIQPDRMLDIGCGSGQPLLAFLREGYNAHGFDYSNEMIEQTKQLLLSNGLDSARVSRNNMEKIEGISPGFYDCIVGLGSLYYSRNFGSTISQISSLLPKGGDFIFSLRNELFSLFSQNAYTSDFLLQKLIPSASLTPDLKTRIAAFLGDKFSISTATKKFLTIDEQKIFSLYHNPLTVEKDVLAPAGFALKGIYYYHYHALPPEFEHSDTEEFRRLSCELENPTDWRGMFMSSSFVVHAVKTE